MNRIRNAVGRAPSTVACPGSRRRVVSSFSKAIVCVALGDTDQSFRWLEKSFEVREDALVSLLVNPRLDLLRSDPRFADLSRRVGLPVRGDIRA